MRTDSATTERKPTGWASQKIVGDEMDEQNTEIAHCRIVTRQEDGQFSHNLRIRHRQAANFLAN